MGQVFASQHPSVVYVGSPGFTKEDLLGGLNLQACSYARERVSLFLGPHLSCLFRLGSLKSA